MNQNKSWRGIVQSPTLIAGPNTGKRKELWSVSDNRFKMSLHFMVSKIQSNTLEKKN